VQSLEEEKGTTFSVLLRLLQKKREERKASTPGPVKDIWVDFDLYVAPNGAPACNLPIRGMGNHMVLVKLPLSVCSTNYLLFKPSFLPLKDMPPTLLFTESALTGGVGTIP
jgi:hypothetical protein